MGKAASITINIEKLKEDNVYLATSDDLDGLFVQADTEDEIYDLSRELAQELIQIDDTITTSEPLNINYKINEG